MAIQLTDLTNGSTKREAGTQPVWEGTAIFDVLMKAVNENINIQYELTRITGSDYSTVYLGAIETCIKEATNLLLQKAIADKEIEVKEAQILSIQEDTRLKSAQADAFPLQASKELDLTVAKIATETEESKLKAAQANAFPLQAEQELALTTEQVLTQKEETKLKKEQALAFPLQSAKDLLVKQSQIDIATEDIKLKKEDIKLKTAQLGIAEEEIKLKKEGIKVAIEEAKLKAAQAVAFPAQAAKDLLVKDAQINVANEEKRLKAAQADAYPGQVAKDNSVKQANIELLNRQTEGFDDNKHQKLFEAQMNAWALMFSSGLLETKPQIISNDSASSLYNTLKPK